MADFSSADARFWNRLSRRYATSPVADPAGWERSLERTRGLLGANSRVLELGCGTGSTALRLAGSVDHYLATDISREMIVIANEKLAAERAAGRPLPSLSFRTATVETLSAEDGRFDAVLGFNYLHLVRDLPATLLRIHTLLGQGGLFVSKTPCLGDMNPLVRWVALPLMRSVGKAPHTLAFDMAELRRRIEEAGFDVVASEIHASGGPEPRPYIVARRR